MAKVIADFNGGHLGDSIGPSEDLGGAPYGWVEGDGGATYVLGRGGGLAVMTSARHRVEFYQDGSRSQLMPGIGCYYKPGPYRSALRLSWYDPTTTTTTFSNPLIELDWNDTDIPGGNLFINTSTNSVPPDHAHNVNYTVAEDQWFDFSLTAKGDWRVKGDAAGVIASGNIGITMSPAGKFSLTAITLGPRSGHPEPDGSLWIDDVYVTSNPVARLYPRDDGLGIDGNSRIHPPPKSRRIVGGHL